MTITRKVYGVSDLGEIHMTSSSIKKITKRSVTLKEPIRAYGYRTRVSLNEVAFSPEEAVKNFVEREYREISKLKRNIAALEDKIQKAKLL